MSRHTPPTYKTRNWPVYNEALKHRGSLSILFDPEMSWEATSTGRRGRHAVILPRKNAKPWKAVTAGAAARNEILRASKYLGRALWRRWSGYHRRSRVETKMQCVKLLGQRLMAWDFNRQVTELHVRIAVLNGYTALGITVTVAVG